MVYAMLVAVSASGAAALQSAGLLTDRPPLQVLPGSLQHHPQQGAGSVCTVPVSPVSCDVLPGTFMPGRGLGVCPAIVF